MDGLHLKEIGHMLQNNVDGSRFNGSFNRKQKNPETNLGSEAGTMSEG